MKVVGAFLGLLAVAAVTEVVSQTTATKKTYCEICVQHTMCLYPDPSVKGLGYMMEGVTSKDVATILRAHNNYRSLVASGNETRGKDGSVQPPAANMRKMTWDSELAAIAQRWANQCIWRHDICRNVNRFQVGQNAYTYSRSKNVTGAEWVATIDAWYNEVDLFDGKKVPSFEFASEIAHYTQVVWADTYLIGCGYTYYVEPPWYTKIYFCNYGPTGNWIKEALYIVGAAGSQCPSGTVANSTDGLCWKNSTLSSAATTTEVPTTTTGIPTTTNGAAAKLIGTTATTSAAPTKATGAIATTTGVPTTTLGTTSKTTGTPTTSLGITPKTTGALTTTLGTTPKPTGVLATTTGVPTKTTETPTTTLGPTPKTTGAAATTTAAPPSTKGLAGTSTTLTVQMDGMTCVCTASPANTTIATTPVAKTTASTTTATTTASVESRNFGTKKKMKKEKP